MRSPAIRGTRVLLPPTGLMCGIYGAASWGTGAIPTPAVLEAMGRALAHRGPHDHRVLSCAHAAGGVERLRITDPRPTAAQPFVDPTERVWVSCNGAIYNAQELRGRYHQFRYRSRSDVEPIVPLYLDRGPEGIEDLDGMFALAIWDAADRRLTLARDRAGEKPLFYTRVQDAVLYASEIQALLAEPRVARRADPDAELEYLAFGYARAPRTLYDAISAVPPGTILTFDSSGESKHTYWRLDPPPRDTSESTDTIDQLDEILTVAVRKQLAADVPVGVFLSGGVDSSLLTALAVGDLGPGAVTTFAVGFSERTFDERAPAQRIAAALGTPHVEVTADQSTLAAALDEIVCAVAEPIADPAVLPTLALARAARERVGIVLSGEGADELFLGYPTYVGHRLARRYANLPGAARWVLTRAVGALPSSSAKVPVEYLLKRFVAHAGDDPAARHVSWFGTGLYHWIDPAARDRLDLRFPVGDDVVACAALFDYRTYLAEGLLPKIDRATMRVGLEARAPFLDPDVTRFAFARPSSRRMRGLDTKWLLKQVAGRHLPEFVTRRRKRGLSVPIAAWLRSELRTEVEALPESSPIVCEGLLDRARVGQLVRAHMAGETGYARALWALLVHARWRQRWIGG